MEGLIEEGRETIEEDQDAPFGDIMIIGAASRVEHYEIAGYSSVIEMARALGKDEVAELLSQTLEEEEAARETLSEKGTTLIQTAAEEVDQAEPEEAKEEDAPKHSGKRTKAPSRGASSGNRKRAVAS